MKSLIKKIFGNRVFRFTSITLVALVFLSAGAVDFITHLPIPDGKISNTPYNQPWKLKNLPDVDPAVSKILPDGTYNFTTKFIVKSGSGASLKKVELSEVGTASFKDGQCAMKSEAKGSEIIAPSDVNVDWNILLLKGYDSATFQKILTTQDHGKAIKEDEGGFEYNIWEDTYLSGTGSMLSIDWLEPIPGIINSSFASDTICSLSLLSRAYSLSSKGDGKLKVNENKIEDMGKIANEAWSKRQVDAVTNKFNFILRHTLEEIYPYNGAIYTQADYRITNDNGVVTLKATRGFMSLTTILTPTSPVLIKAPNVDDWSDSWRKIAKGQSK